MVLPPELKKVLFDGTTEIIMPETQEPDEIDEAETLNTFSNQSVLVITIPQTQDIPEDDWLTTFILPISIMMLGSLTLIFSLYINRKRKYKKIYKIEYKSRVNQDLYRYKN